MTFLSRNTIFKASAIIIPLLFLIIAITITSYVERMYEATESELIQNQSRFAANEFAENLKSQFLSRVKILEISSQSHPDIFPKNKNYYEKNTPIILKNMSGFYAVNWIAPDGFIRWIYPEKGNQAAMNQPIFERPDVHTYLAASRAERTAKVSHVVNLYQGPKGIVIYVPIYEGDKFRGWYNGVIEIDKFLNEFLAPKSLQSLFIKIKWEGHDDYSFDYGTPSPKAKKLKFEIPLLNQKLLVETHFLATSAVGKRQKQMHWIFIIIYISLAIMAAFMFYLIRSQFVFMKLNSMLTRDRTIISVLSHDMATPLTLMIESAKRIKEKLKGQDHSDIDRLLRSGEKQMGILNRVRAFHATNIGKIHIDLEPVSTSELISEAVMNYEEFFQSKEITYSVENPDGILYCLTDKMTAVDNVLGNVISNAIKFSEPKSKITIRSYKHKHCTVIEVEDHGKGIPKEVLEHLFSTHYKTSRQGTQGEAGTGLGMLQIKAFMEYYKGYVKIHTSERGTKVQLHFRSSDMPY